MPRPATRRCPRCGEKSRPETDCAADARHSPKTPADNPKPGQTELCPLCLSNPPPWGRFYFYAAYSTLTRELIQRLKFQAELPLAWCLGSLLGALPELAARKADYDCLTPIPLHKERLTQRGFNQALEIARPLARLLDLPLRPELLRRVLPTSPQPGLSRAQRALNLQEAFSAPELTGERILLLDDVLTTGATMRAACACLLRAGAGSLDVAAPVRTEIKDSEQFHFEPDAS